MDQAWFDSLITSLPGWPKAYCSRWWWSWRQCRLGERRSQRSISPSACLQALGKGKGPIYLLFIYLSLFLNILFLLYFIVWFRFCNTQLYRVDSLNSALINPVRSSTSQQLKRQINVIVPIVRVWFLVLILKLLKLKVKYQHACLNSRCKVLKPQSI